MVNLTSNWRALEAKAPRWTKAPLLQKRCRSASRWQRIDYGAQQLRLSLRPIFVGLEGLTEAANQRLRCEPADAVSGIFGPPDFAVRPGGDAQGALKLPD